MAYIEKRGKGLKETRELEKENSLHHIRLYGGDGAGPDAKSWVIEHHSNENDSDPIHYESTDADSVLTHLGHHANLLADGEEIHVHKSGHGAVPEDEEGRG
jgi:hypothetical protein